MPSGNGAARMYARRKGDAWEALAPAKLNLHLDVLGKRADGFHELETLLAPIRLYDHLGWTPRDANGETSFSLAYHPTTPASLSALAPADERNLVWRAVHRLAEIAGCEPHGAMTLTKRIPIQAGLGGGSSDAAAALVLANQAWGLDYPLDRLSDLAAELGSDVPFFLAGQSAVCRGRGERVEPVGDMPRLNVVVCVPRQGVSTADCFRVLNAPAWEPGAAEPSRGRIAELLAGLRRGALAAALQRISNSLQSPALSLCPPIERVGAAFAALGCYAHQLTGSGSAYFGVLRSARHARRAASILSAANLGSVFATATCR
jgi:4-diphosphocytidyl-2-C-methyl-D-erythritol kinase